MSESIRQPEKKHRGYNTMNEKNILNELLSLANFSSTELSNPDLRHRALAVVDKFLTQLESGELRSAQRAPDGVWHANSDVKKGILFCFRVGKLTQSQNGNFSFVDKDTLTNRFEIVKFDN